MPNLTKNKIRRSYCFKEIHINNGRSISLFFSIVVCTNYFSIEKIDDFALIDYSGIEHSLSDYRASKFIPLHNKQNAQFENYLLKIVEPEDFINLLGRDWSGAIPTTFNYNKNGKQIEVLIGKQSHEEFEKAINKVIN